MADAYYYSTTAGEMRLVGGVSYSAGSIDVDTVVGLPASLPYKLVIDPGLSSEEIVKVTAVAGTSLTVVRGWDGSTGVAHSNSAVVRHMATAEDFRLARQHESATSGVHGAAFALVDEESPQTMTNKTFQASSSEVPVVVKQQGVSSADLLEAQDSSGGKRWSITTLALTAWNGANEAFKALVNGTPVLRLAPQNAPDSGLVVDMPVGSSGRAIVVKQNSVDRFFVEPDGDAYVEKNLVVDGAVTPGSVAASGAVTGASMATVSLTVSTSISAGTSISGGTVASTGQLSGAYLTVAGAASTGAATVNGNVTSTGNVTASGTLSGSNFSSGWTSYTPAVTASGSNPTLGNSVVVGKYRQVGKMVDCVIKITTGSSFAAGSGVYYFSVPTAYANIEDFGMDVGNGQAIITAPGGRSAWVADLLPSSQGVTLWRDGGNNLGSSGPPTGWGVGTIIGIMLSYPLK